MTGPFLTIRAGQAAVLEEAQWRQFVDRMSGHVRTYFPQCVSSIGEDQFREWLQQVLADGRARGLKSARDLCRYVNARAAAVAAAMESVEWMEAIWRDPWVRGAGAKLDRIVAAFTERLEVEAVNDAARRAFLKGDEQ